MQPTTLLFLIELIIGFPLSAFALMGIFLVLGFKPAERYIGWLLRIAIFLSMLALAPLLHHFWIRGFKSQLIEAAPFFSLPTYRFHLGFIIDIPSLTMAALTLILAGIVARFAHLYLHLEAGFNRFFALLSLFTGSTLLTIFASTYDQLFIGWELVGLASAFLVAFFHHRTGPTRAGLRIFITYRVSDVGLLLAAAGMHHYININHIPLPGELSEANIHSLSPIVLTMLGLGIATGAMGKAAQLPLGGWLPRAMEGPTPSSAIFYGGLSVHMGIYLLIRSYPILERGPGVKFILIAVGAATFIYASTIVRTQTDVKSSLAHATMAQLGLMVVEVGLGFTKIALVHMCAHAILRTWQLLRAPHRFQEAANIYAALAANGPAPALSHPAQSLFLYRLSLTRFSIDTLTERYLLYPLIGLGRVLEAFERRVDTLLCGFSNEPIQDSSQENDADSAEVPEAPKPHPHKAEHHL